MRIDSPRRPQPWRALLVACVSMLGVVAIVGSTGGSLGFPPCDDKTICDQDTPPPVPTAAVDPPYLTALVGSPASFGVVTANTTGTFTFQWRRSNDGGATYVDIAGATLSTYSIAGVNLGDDQTLLRVDLRSNGVLLFQPVARLAVSAVPGLVFEDTEFLAASWQASPVPTDTGAAITHVDESLTAGGNPGAFRKMTFQVPNGAGSARVFYSSLASTYDPAAQGAVYVIDYSEDCVAFQPNGLSYTQSSLLIEQSGRRFLSNNFDSCVGATWSTTVKRASLAPSDFRLFDGPACTAGESCPDFSASAAPMRFGYWRIAFGSPAGSVAHGIDNWKVTVWKR